MPDTYDAQTGEVYEGTAVPTGAMSLPAVVSEEINSQIATARAYPRSMQKAKANIESLVLLDEQSAEECIYALPRGKKPIQGPSIRFAEALRQSFGNCRSMARVTEINRIDKYVEAEGVFIDLESNTATSARVRRRIVDKYGKIYTDDMILVTGNAASSIAMRNAILSGVPKPVWREAYAKAVRVVAGDETTLVVRRDGAIKAFAHFGVKPEQLFEAIGVAGLEDVTVSHIVTLLGMHSSIKNGESTVEELFAPEKKVTDPNYDPAAAAANAVKGGQKTKTSPEPAASSQAEPSSPEKTAPDAENLTTASGAGNGVTDDDIIRDAQRSAGAGDDKTPPEDLTEAQSKLWIETFENLEKEANA